MASRLLRESGWLVVGWVVVVCVCLCLCGCLCVCVCVYSCVYVKFCRNPVSDKTSLLILAWSWLPLAVVAALGKVEACGLEARESLARSECGHEGGRW